MELLIVGAGAVGSVYGYFASRCLAPEAVRVTYLVKPKHRKDIENGIKLYHWMGRRAEPIEFKTFTLIDSLEEVSNRKFDAVLITLPSDKMIEGDWLESLIKAVKTAKLWSLQPNPNDREFIREKMKAVGTSDRDRNLIFGSIPIMSYLAPMPGEHFSSPGYAFYIPPTSKASWSSKISTDAEYVARLFTAGGLAGKVVPENDSSGILPEALLRCMVAGLEKSEWSFDRLFHGPNLPFVIGGIREMTAILAKRAGVKDPGGTLVGRFLSTPLGVRLAICIAKWIMPFDFEAFLRVHFTKVSEQMHQAIRDMIGMAKMQNQPTVNLQFLKD